jgi:hypothetical protein
MGQRSMRSAVAALVLALALVPGCGKKKAKPEVPKAVAGLAAIPAGARVVIGIDVGRVAEAPLIQHAVGQMLLRDPELAQRIDRLLDDCQLDPVAQLQTVHIGLADQPTKEVGRPVVMVVSGKLVETDLATCVGKTMSASGGSLTTSQVGGRTIYKAAGGERAVWFAFGNVVAPGPDGLATLIVSPSEEWLGLAVGSGPRVLDDPEMAQLVATADQSAGIWAAGKVAGTIGSGLVKVTGGQIKNPPQAMVASLDAREGIRFRLDVMMSAPEEANILKSFAQTQLGLLATLGQIKGLGPLLAKIGVETTGSKVTFQVQATEAEVRDALSKMETVDTGGSTSQDAAPGNPTDPDAGTPAAPALDAGAPH